MWLVFKNSLLFFTVSLLAGCGQIFEMLYCDYGYGAVQNNFYQPGVNLLNKCLELDRLSNDQRAKFLQGRAWAHFNLENNKLALADQESAFELKPPTQHFEFINHAAYLRRLQLFQESLAPLKAAQNLDQQGAHTSMMTQYNLGWSLYELGRFEEAVEAFSTGMRLQPDYPFAYLRRGLVFYNQGKSISAKEDFSDFLMLAGDRAVNIPAALKKEIKKLPAEYSEFKNFIAQLAAE